MVLGKISEWTRMTFAGPGARRVTAATVCALVFVGFGPSLQANASSQKNKIYKSKTIPIVDRTVPIAVISLNVKGNSLWVDEVHAWVVDSTRSCNYRTDLRFYDSRGRNYFTYWGAMKNNKPSFHEGCATKHGTTFWIRNNIKAGKVCAETYQDRKVISNSKICTSIVKK